MNWHFVQPFRAMTQENSIKSNSSVKQRLFRWCSIRTLVNQLLATSPRIAHRRCWSWSKRARFWDIENRASEIDLAWGGVDSEKWSQNFNRRPSSWYKKKTPVLWVIPVLRYCKDNTILKQCLETFTDSSYRQSCLTARCGSEWPFFHLYRRLTTFLIEYGA